MATVLVARASAAKACNYGDALRLMRKVDLSAHKAHGACKQRFYDALDQLERELLILLCELHGFFRTNGDSLPFVWRDQRRASKNKKDLRQLKRK